MSTERAKKVMTDFLTSPRPDALVLRGRWGTGKTYTWTTLVNEIATVNKIGMPKYSYVSLFGINSLDQLKNAIFEHTLAATAIPQGASFTTLRKNLEDIFAEPADSSDEVSTWQRIKGKLNPSAKVLDSQARKSVSYAEGIPFLKDFIPFVRSASFLSVKDTIICIDDFERKGNGLAAKEILGLISVLKEQRNCKIAIILNDGSLQGETLEEYERYREKVVDIEIEFLPSSEECADLVFNYETLSDTKARENAIKLNIRNIRILQRIKRHIDVIWPELERCEMAVQHQVVHSLTLMVWSFYSKEGDSLPLDYILQSSEALFAGAVEGKNTDEERHWNSILTHYGYYSADELDLELAEYIRKGFYLKTALQEKLELKNNESKANETGSSYRDAWRLYHNSFHDNEDELIGTIGERFRTSARYLSPRDLQIVIDLFRELDHDSLADDLIDVYVSENRYRPKVYALDSDPFRSDIKDHRIIQRFAEVASGFELKRSLAEVIRDASKNGYSRKDEEILANATPDEYYAFFKSEVAEDLYTYVETCLKLGRLGNATDSEKSIAGTAAEALKRIARESKLNQIRVKRFGMHIESTELDQSLNQGRSGDTQ